MWTEDKELSSFLDWTAPSASLRAGLGGCPLISVADELKVVAGVVGYAAPCGNTLLAH